MATAAATTAAGIDAVYYMTQNFQRARNFYEDLFGLSATFEMTGDGGGSFVEYELADGATFGLGYMAQTPFNASGGIMFAVPDVQATLERAKDLGARVGFEPMELRSCHMAAALDPEGNMFYLHHRKDGSVG